MFGLCSVCSASKYPVYTDVFDLSTDVDISRPISVNQLLSRGRPPASSCINVDEFSRFFSEKVSAVRSSTDGVLEPVFSPRATWNIAGVIHFGYC